MEFSPQQYFCGEKFFQGAKILYFKINAGLNVQPILEIGIKS
jgi:hypothetical protein